MEFTLNCSLANVATIDDLIINCDDKSENFKMKTTLNDCLKILKHLIITQKFN